MLRGRLANPVTLDSNGRLVVPKAIREDVEDANGVSSFHVGCLLDKCLYLHTDEQHDAFLSAFEQELGDSEEDRELKTNVHSCFSPVQTDKAGRITIPQDLLGAAEINEKIVVVGMRERVELWGIENHAPLDAVRSDPVFRKQLEKVLGRTTRRHKDEDGAGQQES